tara:strand:- start:1842 stop:3611 length:1770 start_codon:yes stop_codon:yes gene_type:complete
LPLLQRLKARKHVDQIALTQVAASKIDLPRNEFLTGSAEEIIRRYWQDCDYLIFVGAIGAVVRLIAPFLENKSVDPAVLVIDANSLNIIPLIGGHQSGGDQLALALAEDIGAKTVFTSDSKSFDRIPLDSFGFAWGWDRSGLLENWKNLMISYSNGEFVRFNQSLGSTLWQNTSYEFKNLSAENSNDCCSLSIGITKDSDCCWHPHNLWIGIGCERNSSKKLINRAIDEVFLSAGLAKESIAGISSIDLKSDEEGLIELLDDNSWSAKFYSAESLSRISVPNPSLKVNQEIGTPSVSEASALLAAGEGGQLLVQKNIFSAKDNELGAVTISIAKSLKSFAPLRGELHLIGSGPGEISYLTNDARFALSRCVVWIGYKPYLDYLEPLRRTDQVRIDSRLTQEKVRCKEALDLANEGIKVALISSGDTGIYGLAGLALELLLQQSKDQRPSFQVHPGISAVQMAAAKSGAPLVNDFCVISLSDLLTPWEKIEQRLMAAAESDFVVGIYNPRSLGRDWQLKQAIEIFLAKRLGSTPVLFARQLGRVEEEIKTYRLDSFPCERVDMLTVLLIGNSKSLLKDGFFVTARGYSLN